MPFLFSSAELRAKRRNEELEEEKVCKLVKEKEKFQKIIR